MHLRKSSLFVLIFSILFSIQGHFCFSQESTNSQYIFNNDLTVGSESEDVLQLQKILIDLGYFIETSDTKLGYFDEATKDAVTMYQIINSISPTSGFFGPITRESMNNKTAQGQSVSEEAVNGNSVELLVEPKTYIPAFYKGAPLFTNQSTVKIIAFPKVIADGKLVSSSNLNFTWKNNDIIFSNSSGIGKDTLTFNSGLLFEDPNITLDVYDSNKKLVASNSVVLNIRDPQILFYESDPLYGVLFNKNLNVFYNLGTKEELRIVAKPLSFSVSNDTSSDLTYDWTVNGSKTELSGRKNTLLLRQSSTNESGATPISLTISNTANDFQSATKNLEITFGE